MKRIIGRWKITAMVQWDLEYIDMTEPGFIAFQKGGWGQLYLELFHGGMR